MIWAHLVVKHVDVRLPGGVCNASSEHIPAADTQFHSSSQPSDKPSLADQPQQFTQLHQAHAGRQQEPPRQAKQSCPVQQYCGKYVTTVDVHTCYTN
jgi:hypothetical protein